MTASEMETVEQVWPRLAPLLRIPHTEQAYERLLRMLDTLTDVVGEAEDHPLASLMEIVGVLIERYEDEHIPELA